MDAKTHASHLLFNSKKFSYQGSLRLAWNMLVEHQIEIPLIIILAIITGDILRIPLAAKFLRIQYRVPGEENLYLNGTDDLYFISFWVVAFTFIRAAVMEYVLKPIAKHGGIRSYRTLHKFLEQSWLFVYYAVSWSIGFYIIYNSPFWRNTSHFWIDYPHKAIPHLSKWYYLVQTGFWLQQFFVLHAENRRKDYPQMIVHHVVTSLMVTCSYVTYFTRIGTAVLCIMDSADVVLALAKSLRYLKFQKLCDHVFGCFVLVWAYTRHYLFFMIMWSIWQEAEVYLTIDCRPMQGKFICHELQYFFIALFAILQVLMLYWFAQIIRVITQVIRGSEAADCRSESESQVNMSLTLALGSDSSEAPGNERKRQ
ncbi:longevity assurance proteins LAG1/LAC1 [Basidiobolus meristosporus CBS 931.73]|uniref:Longevity assurance proteins LAG1/LAC1 n=1 Tax=Basidiobolus meristosporus CBS 931.73 TaxID=1314790 RepID=A0A1Y1WW78_9FUNG|nr:longevity assurance proteins LAG1/LAC1 [Basidiobolus meristosporus CBS 931.73]|eukprot:ORX77807.1 longevity assurance proteins LAG1/LAC1 [Basidiobolus meristosporus CBS 931.73]